MSKLCNKCDKYLFSFNENDEEYHFLAKYECISCEDYFCDLCSQKIYSGNYDNEIICDSCFKDVSMTHIINKFFYQCDKRFKNDFHINEIKDFLIGYLEKLKIINCEEFFINNIDDIIQFIKNYKIIDYHSIYLDKKYKNFLVSYLKKLDYDSCYKTTVEDKIKSMYSIEL